MQLWCCVVFSVTERSYDVLGSTEEPLVSPVLMLDNQYGGYHPVDTRRNLSSETSPSCNWLKGNLVQRQTNDLQVVPLYWEGISTGKKVKCTGIRVSISSRMWWKDWRWGQSIWVHHFLLTASYTLQDWRLYFHFQCTHTEVMLFQRGEHIALINKNGLMIVYCIHCRISFCRFFYFFFCALAPTNNLFRCDLINQQHMTFKQVKKMWKKIR